MKTVLDFVPDRHNSGATDKKLPGKNCMRTTRRKNGNPAARGGRSRPLGGTGIPRDHRHYPAPDDAVPNNLNNAHQWSKSSGCHPPLAGGPAPRPPARILAAVRTANRRETPILNSVRMDMP